MISLLVKGEKARRLVSPVRLEVTLAINQWLAKRPIFKQMENFSHTQVQFTSETDEEFSYLPQEWILPDMEAQSWGTVTAKNEQICDDPNNLGRD